MNTDTHRSTVNGKTYHTAIWTEKIVNSDTGCEDRHYLKIVGSVNGKRIMSQDAHNTSENISDGYFSMRQALESFIDGNHHPTHYADFPELVK